VRSPGHVVVPSLAARGRIALTEPELVTWGKSFGRAVLPPLVVAVSGEVGSGKTTLVQAICRGYGVVESVTSPTFALIHQYGAPRSPVYHVDLYRLEHGAQLTNIGWDEVVASHALVLVEWPERAGERLPPAHVPLALGYAPDDPSRRVLLAG
jgi:tRNA threonylcarbamoyl adenosine modification protein YjeE